MSWRCGQLVSRVGSSSSGSNSAPEGFVEGGSARNAFCANCSVRVLMRDERKKEASKQGQTNNKANFKQHSMPKAVTFPKKNEVWDSNPRHSTL